MPGQLKHPVDAIVAKVLWANRAIGSDPAPWAAYIYGKGTKPTGAWPVFEGSEPDQPDDVITVYETTPLVHARIQVTGEEQQHRGFTIRVRGRDKNQVRQKAEDVSHDLLRNFLDQTVTLTTPTQQYLIPSVAQARVVPFGKMTSPNGVGLWLVNVNCLAVILAYPIQG